jgi:iron(III) transport system permease protein
MMTAETAVDANRSRARQSGEPVEPLAYGMTACVLGVSVVIVALLVAVLWLSIVKGSPGVGDAEYTVSNFAEVFTDVRTAHVVWDTAVFSFVSLVVAMAFGVPAAWLVSRTDLPGKTALFTLMTVGMVIPGFTSAMGWLFLMHPRIGILNTMAVKYLGFASAPFNIASLAGMGWVQGLNLAPLAFIMTAAVFAAMDPSLEEASLMSGAGRMRTTLRVVLPLAAPGVLAAAIYIFTIGFAAFDVPAIIGWGNRIFTFSTFLYLLISPQDVLPKYGVAAALSTIVMVFAGVLSWWYAGMQKRSRRYAVVTGKAYRPRLTELGLGVYAAWAFLGFFFILSAILPILLLAWSSLLPFFQMPSALAFKVASFAHYKNLPWSLALSGLANTAVLMVLTPTLTLAISLAFSWVVLRSKIPMRWLFDFIAFLPHAIPNIIFGVGALLVTLYVLQRALPIYGTVWVLLIVFIVGRLSYGTRMTNAGLVQLHTELEESAQMSGATLGAVWRRVVAPLLAPTLLYAWLWIALLTYRELTLAVVLSSGSNITLPVVIWGLWQGGGLGQASALAMIMLCAMIPLITLYWAIARRAGVAAET